MVNDIVVGILTYLAIKALEKLIEYIVSTQLKNGLKGTDSSLYIYLYIFYISFRELEPLVNTGVWSFLEDILSVFRGHFICFQRTFYLFRGRFIDKPFKQKYNQFSCLILYMGAHTLTAHIEY